MSDSDRPSEIKFVKSTYSGGSGNCVEVGKDPVTGLIAVRHSRHPASAPLLFNNAEWVAFVNGVHAGQFEPDSLPQ